MLLFWALVIPFGTAVLALLAWRSLEMQRGISLIGALALLVLTVRIAIRVATEGPFAEQAGGWPAPYGITLVADGLSAVRPGEFPFAHLQAYMDDIVLVSERELAEAFRTLLFRAKLLSEPAGAVASAGWLAGRVDTDRTTVSVVSGGNLTEDTVQKLLRMSQ